MKIEVGRYEMDLDFDPRIQNNASDVMIPIDDIGFISIYQTNNLRLPRNPFPYYLVRIKHRQLMTR